MADYIESIISTNGRVVLGHGRCCTPRLIERSKKRLHESARMKAIVLEQPQQFAMHDIDEPIPPGPGEALVKVHRVGICGSDISGYLGKMPFFSYPRIPGHELGVEIVEVGSDVTTVKVGDKCSVEPYINNPDSYASRRHQSNCCNELQVLGVHTDGGLRPHFIVPARKLHKSEGLEMEQLALVETLAIGCHAVDRSQCVAGEHLLIIGAGPIGLTVVEFAKLAGAEVTVMDMNQQRLQFCKEKMGVPHTVKFTGDSPLECLEEITGGDLYPVVVDATGSNKSMSTAIDYCAPTGKLVFVGITTQELTYPHPVVHRKELSLLASRNALPKDFVRIISLIEEGKIDTQPWITHRVAFDDMIDRFVSYTKPETGVIKAIVEVT